MGCWEVKSIKNKRNPLNSRRAKPRSKQNDKEKEWEKNSDHNNNDSDDKKKTATDTPRSNTSERCSKTYSLLKPSKSCKLNVKQH